MIIKHGRHIFGDIYEVRKGLWVSDAISDDTVNIVNSAMKRQLDIVR